MPLTRLYRINLPAVFVAIVGLAVFAAPADAQDEAPNILIILADDMGWGDPTSFNENSQIPTENIDQLAAEGMRFTDAHSPGAWCVPTRYSLMTGRYSIRTDYQWREEAVISEDRLTLPQMLKNAGYDTAMIGKWHLGFEAGYEAGFPHDRELRGGPVDRGFDEFFGIHASLDIEPYFYIRNRHPVAAPTNHVEARGPEQDHWNRIQGPFWREGGISPGLAHEDVLPRFREEAVSYLERQGREQDDNPFFLYLALPAPHTPWLPLEEYEGTSGAGMYGDFTVQVDDMVGDVMKALDRLDMAEDTLVIFTSDNGPTWYDKDVERWDHRSTGPYRGMKGGAWEGGHRMPFIARWPGHVPEGATSDQLLSFTDFMATFAAITGQELSANEAPDSENLLPAFLGESSEPLRQTFVVDAGGTVGLRVGDWKFIPHKLSTGFTPNPPKEERQELPPVQLYNLAEDPGEQNNLHDQEPDKLEEMKQTLQQIREQE